MMIPNIYIAPFTFFHRAVDSQEERVSSCLEASESGDRRNKKRAKASRKLNEARVKNARKVSRTDRSGYILPDWRLSGEGV